MNSVRHLAIGRDGTIVAGQQFMGDAHEHADLLAIKRPGRPFEAFPVAEEQRLAMAQYTASVAIHDDLRLVALTAPRGNRFFIWDLDSGAVRLDAPLPDCAGVGAVKNGFVVTSDRAVAASTTARASASPRNRWSCLPASGTTTCTWPESAASTSRHTGPRKSEATCNTLEIFRQSCALTSLESCT